MLVMHPRISVIIPTLNEEENISDLLEILTGYLHNKLSTVEPLGIEIIVSDGGSTDDTFEVCRRFPVTFISGQHGRGKQLNTGAAKASGDVLLFLHADSRVGSEVFAELGRALAGGNKWGCLTIGFDEKKLLYKVVALASHLRAKLFSSCYGDQGIFCERGLFAEVGGFPDMPVMEDIALSNLLRPYSKAKVLNSRLVTSTRRFKQSGPIRQIIKIQVIKLLYYFGVSAHQLAKVYRPFGREGR